MRQKEVFSHDLCDNEANESFERLVLQDAKLVKPIFCGQKNSGQNGRNEAGQARIL